MPSLLERERANSLFASDQFPSDDKQRVNEWIWQAAETIFKGISPASLRGITLDGAQLYTTRQWIEHLKMEPQNIVVPNPFLFEEIRTAQQTSPVLSLVKSHPLLFYDAILKEPGPFNLVFLDFCCTWNGNKYCRPRIDIERLFILGSLTPNSLLAVTLCTRNRSHFEVDPVVFITRCARFYDKEATILHADSYSPSIRFILVHLQTCSPKPVVEGFAQESKEKKDERFCIDFNWLCRELAEVRRANQVTKRKIDQLTNRLKQPLDSKQHEITNQLWRRFVEKEILVSQIPPLPEGYKRRPKGAVKKTAHTEAWETYKRFCSSEDPTSTALDFDEFRTKMLQWMAAEHPDLALHNEDPKLGMVHDCKRNVRGAGFAGIQIRSLLAKEKENQASKKKRKLRTIQIEAETEEKHEQV